VNDLTQEEQDRVRVAIRFLRIRFGKAMLLANALGFKASTVRRVLEGRDMVSPTMVLRVARLAGVPFDDVVTGRYPVKGMCPHCGRGPSS
jgi:transcriptional regulator with XRE-family HTH domain